jgi:aspartate beta-hydroxylase
MCRLTDAKRILEDTLRRWPQNGFAQVHYGFILKTGDNNNEAAVDYLTRGIATREPGTIDGRFFFHLGDALTRLGRREETSKVTRFELVMLISHSFKVTRLVANILVWH